MPKKKAKKRVKRGMCFVEPKSPLDDFHVARTSVEILTQVGVDTRDQEALVKRLRHYEYGYSAEMECAAILAWLGNCSVVHRLVQDAYVHSDLGDLIVPDLLAVFSREGCSLPVAIEVKSTDSLYVPWSDEYQAKLRRYSEAVNLPVLLAWRPRRFGHWLLVDALSENIVANGRVDLAQAMMHNLMTVVAGDFWITPMPGVGLNFRSTIIGEKKPMPDGYSGTMRIERAYFGTRQEELKELSQSSIALIVAAASEEYFEESEGAVSSGFVVPEDESDGTPGDGGMICSQDLLRSAVGWSRKPDQRIAWRHVLAQLESIMPKRQMEDDLGKDIGTAVRYILHVLPTQMPEFVPSAWYKTSKG